MRNDNRWVDFLDMIQKEHILQIHFSDAIFIWTIDKLELFTQLNGGVYEIIPQSKM